MPEGPELHLASQFVNLVSKGRIFRGPIFKSAVSKHAEVEFDGDFTISAMSRGKEMKLTLASTSADKKPRAKGQTLDIVFQFGMSGRFDFYEATELKKHAHLNFFTRDEPRMVLSYVDFRRFGKWQVGGAWSEDRGPCVLFEYQDFRKNVLDNVSKPIFNKPICEFLLNQKYFNGIGNYLRAEILFRAGIPPFVSARSVLEPLVEEATENGVSENVKVKSEKVTENGVSRKVKVKAEKVTENGVSKKLTIKTEGPDILQLCHILPQEVIKLGVTGYDPEGRDPDYSKFMEWLQCYYQPGMTNMADHNKRTIWYHGNPGPMVPKDIKTRKIKRSSKQIKSKTKKIKKETEDSDEEDGSSALTRGKLQKAEQKPARKTSKKSSARSSSNASSSSSRKSLKSSALSSKLSVKASEKSSAKSTENSSKRSLKRSAEKSLLNSSDKLESLEVAPKGTKRRKSETSVKPVTDRSVQTRRKVKEEAERDDSALNDSGKARGQGQQVKAGSGGRRKMSASAKNRKRRTC